MKSKQITVIGAGSWGLTLTWLLSEAGRQVCLYTHNEEKARILINEHRINAPVSVVFNPKMVEVTTDLDKAVQEKSIVIVCCTAQSMRETAKKLFDALKTKMGSKPLIVSAAKGLELHSHKRMSEILFEELKGIHEYQSNSIAALSGPNLAKEILQKLPAAAVIASENLSVPGSVQKLISVSNFRVYCNNDVVGVELGGALKNVIAIAAGACDGFDLGANAKAALLTRGLAEITRLAVQVGAKPTTLAGLAGMGDLLTSCNSVLSRNYNLGLQMAKGRSLEAIMQETGAIIEGVTTTQAACELGKKVNVELPVANVVQAFITGSLTPTQAITTLMNRPLASE